MRQTWSNIDLWQDYLSSSHIRWSILRCMKLLWWNISCYRWLTRARVLRATAKLLLAGTPQTISNKHTCRKQFICIKQRQCSDTEMMACAVDHVQGFRHISVTAGLKTRAPTKNIQLIVVLWSETDNDERLKSWSIKSAQVNAFIPRWMTLRSCNLLPVLVAL